MDELAHWYCPIAGALCCEYGVASSFHDLNLNAMTVGRANKCMYWQKSGKKCLIKLAVEKILCKD